MPLRYEEVSAVRTLAVPPEDGRPPCWFVTIETHDRERCVTEVARLHRLGTDTSRFSPPIETARGQYVCCGFVERPDC